MDLLEKDELRKAFQSLEKTVAKVEEIVRTLTKRVSILDEVSNYIESKLIRGNKEVDTVKLRDLVIELADSISNAGKTELEVTAHFILN